MLKIKDNVNLKELEKYGFNYDSKLNEYEIGDIFHGYISINEKDRLINPTYDECMWLEIEDLFYELIKNNLVEKVKGE